MTNQIEERNRRLIEAYGGKAASLEAQRLYGNSKWLLPYHIITNFEDPYSQVPSDFFKKGEIVIFRSSAKTDEKRLVGVLSTEIFRYLGSDLFRKEEEYSLKGVIDFLCLNSNNEEVKKYAEKVDRNFDYKGLESIIVMPYIEGLKGSITDHPNIKDHYIVSLNRGGDYYSDFLLSREGELISSQEDYRTSGFKLLLLSELKDLIKMKEETDSVGFIPKEYSSQTEFVADEGSNLKLLQQRFFRKNQPEIQYDPEDYLFHRFDNGEVCRKRIEISSSKSHKRYTTPLSARLFRDTETILKYNRSSFCSLGGHTISLYHFSLSKYKLLPTFLI